MSILHRNRRLWQRHVLAENKRSIDGLLETLRDDPLYKIMATNEKYQGKDAVAMFYRGLFEGVPDAVFELVNAFVSEEGVVEESLFKGTHNGRLFGLEPTGKVFALPITIIFPIMNEQILGERLYFDVGTLARQLGIAIDRVDE